MPNNLMTGTIVPAKNRDFPQITQFVQMKSGKLADFVYSLANITRNNYTSIYWPNWLQRGRGVFWH